MKKQILLFALLLFVSQLIIQTLWFKKEIDSELLIITVVATVISTIFFWFVLKLFKK